jgi:hypothetical protein
MLTRKSPNDVVETLDKGQESSDEECEDSFDITTLDEFDTDSASVNVRMKTLKDFYEVVEECAENDIKANNRFDCLVANLALYDNNKVKFMEDKANIIKAIAKGYPDEYWIDSQEKNIKGYDLKNAYDAQKKEHRNANQKKGSSRAGYVDNRWDDFKTVRKIVQKLKKKVNSTFTRFLNRLFPVPSDESVVLSIEEDNQDDEDDEDDDKDDDEDDDEDAITAAAGVNNLTLLPITPDNQGTATAKEGLRRSDRKRALESDDEEIPPAPADIKRPKTTPKKTTHKKETTPKKVQRVIIDLTNQSTDQLQTLEPLGLKTLAAGVCNSSKSYSFVAHAETYLECPDNKKAAYKKHCASFFKDDKK